jgi:TonB family protein
MLRTAAALLSGAVACLSTAAMAQDVQPPSWLERPDAATFAEFYPNAALHQGVTGVVQLACLAELDNTASCSVVSESPSNWGFGDAALKISRRFRFAPATRNGRPVRGGRVNVPIRFNFAPPSQRSDRYSSLLARLPQDDVIRVPIWDEAPNFDEVRRAYPRPWADGFAARVNLSCLLKPDRRLGDCRVERAWPPDVGAGEAALALAGAFRVSERETDFLSEFTGRRILVPLYLGGMEIITPVDRFMDGLSASAFPPPPAALLRGVYPPDALSERLVGEAIVRCRTVGRLSCTVVHEAPQGRGFGDAAATFLTTYFGDADLSRLLPEEVYFPILFQPDD